VVVGQRRQIGRDVEIGRDHREEAGQLVEVFHPVGVVLMAGGSGGEQPTSSCSCLASAGGRTDDVLDGGATVGDAERAAQLQSPPRRTRSQPSRRRCDVRTTQSSSSERERVRAILPPRPRETARLSTKVRASEVMRGPAAQSRSSATRPGPGRALMTRPGRTRSSLRSSSIH
jgi:hypothetical protein